MMIVRNITENDVENIVRIENGCFSDAWTDAMWKSEIARPDFFGFILENESEAVGFACATVLFEDAELPKIAVVRRIKAKVTAECCWTHCCKKRNGAAESVCFWKCAFPTWRRFGYTKNVGL